MFKEAFIADSRTAERVFKVQSSNLLRAEYESRVARLERDIYTRMKEDPQVPTEYLAHGPLMDFTTSLMDALAESVQESARDSVHALERLLVRTLGSAAQLDEHAFSAGLRERATVQSELAQRDMAAKIMGHVFVKVAQSPSIGTAKERSVQVSNILDEAWWRIQRVARTETAFAYNAVRIDALRSISSRFPNLMQRWTERLDDPDAQGVSADSVEMHGQVVKIGAHFHMPDSAGRWAHPPNRSNDSAVVTPWQPGWGVPAWSWAGQKIWHP